MLRFDVPSEGATLLISFHRGEASHNTWNGREYIPGDRRTTCNIKVVNTAVYNSYKGNKSDYPIDDVVLCHTYASLRDTFDKALGKKIAFARAIAELQLLGYLRGRSEREQLWSYFLKWNKHHHSPLAHEPLSL